MVELFTSKELGYKIECLHILVEHSPNFRSSFISNVFIGKYTHKIHLSVHLPIFYEAYR